MILIKDISGSLVPGRLYVVATKNDFPIPAWKGTLKKVPFPGLGAFVFRMENAEPWKVSDAYAWFFVAGGKAAIFDAESDRSTFDAIEAGHSISKGMIDAFSRTLIAAADTLEGAASTVKATGSLLSYLPWIVGGVAALGLVLVMIHYARS